MPKFVRLNLDTVLHASILECQILSFVQSHVFLHPLKEGMNQAEAVFLCVSGHAPGQLYTYPARCWRKKRRLNILEDPRLVPIEFKIGNWGTRLDFRNLNFLSLWNLLIYGMHSLLIVYCCWPQASGFLHIEFLFILFVSKRKCKKKNCWMLFWTHSCAFHDLVSPLWALWSCHN